MSKTLLLATTLAALLAFGGRAEARDPAQAKTPKSRQTKHQASLTGALHSVAFSADGTVLTTSSAAKAKPTIGVSVSVADGVLRSQLPATKGRYGLVVTRVLDKSPAAKAGIKVNDLLLSVNRKPLSVTVDLVKVVTAKDTKSPLAIRLLRTGRSHDVKVVIQKPKPKYKIVVWDANTGKHVSTYEIGVETSAAPASLLAQLVLPGGKGVIVDKVKPNTPAAKFGLQKHDLILRIGNEHITKSSDIGRQLDKAAGKPVPLEYLRAGKKRWDNITARKRSSKSGVYYIRPNLRSIGTVNGLKYYGARPQWNRLWDPTVNRLDYEVINQQGIRPYVDFTKSHNDLGRQIGQLSKQISRLQSAIDNLKKAVAAGKNKQGK